MNRITLITPEAVESRGSDQPKWGPAVAARAFQEAGIVDRIAALGLAVDGIERPATVEGDDPIAALGDYNGSIACLVREALSRGSSPVLMGGTCCHLPGMIGGLQQGLPTGTRIGLLWLDAHGDFNTPATTPSGMLGGMPVATVAGLCHSVWREGAGLIAPVPTNRIMMVDVRNLDREEEQLIRATDVRIVRLQEPEALDRIADFANSVDALYIHIDADILDITLQPNHPTAEPGGLDVGQTLSILDAAMASGNVVAFGVVAVNPDGPEGQISLQSGSDLLTGGLLRWLGESGTV